MKFKMYALFISIIIAGSAQAISFATYLKDHEKEIKSMAAGKIIDLSHKHLTDLKDFDEAHIPGLSTVKSINLANNELTAIPRDTFKDLNDLFLLDLDGNPIPLTHDEFVKSVNLPPKTLLFFRTFAGHRFLNYLEAERMEKEKERKEAQENAESDDEK